MVCDSNDMIEDSMIPLFVGPVTYELPDFEDQSYKAVVDEYKSLFRTTPGETSGAYHHIPTSGPPAKIPPRRIPAHYRAEVKKQIEEMLQKDIIEPSSSPWMAPLVCVPKKSGGVRLCVDYRELNKRTVKDAYPLPLPDEVQDRLSNSSVFSTLDLQSGYWQLPVEPNDYQKTAFSPGPGMGLYQFKRMPFGLTGAPGSFQRLMDSIFRGLSFVTTYIDDLLIHSSNAETHLQHLRQVFQRLTEAGLTLHGKKCHIGLSKVTYLGHTFTQSGMLPDQHKIEAIQGWPQPTDAPAIRQFLGLASYYRRYIPNFSNVAAPLTKLTQKGVQYSWNTKCEDAFQLLKSKLSQSPILAYPKIGWDESPFTLQTDASDIGLGAVLEQEGKVIAYASRTLTKSECNYSVIQKECLAIIFALKQFRHYLLGRKFQLMTDHAPLQWLSAQKMQGMLCR